MAIAPIDFTVNVPQPNLAPYLQQRAISLANLQQGISSLGEGIGSAVAIAQKQEQARLDEERAKAFLEQKNKDLDELRRNPSGANRLAYMARYPEDAKAIEPALATIDKEKRSTLFNEIAPIYFAAESGKNDVAIDLAQRRADVLRGAERFQEASAFDSLIETIKSDPDSAVFNLGGTISALDPDRFKDMFTTLTQVRADRLKSEADAKRAAEEAKQAAIDSNFYERAKQLGIAKDEAQIANWAATADIQRENNRIAWLNAKLRGEQNDIERKKLDAELQRLSMDRDTKMREKKADFDRSIGMLDDTKKLVTRLLSTKQSIKDAAHGPFSAAITDPDQWGGKFVPQDVADYQESLKTLKSRNFTTVVETLGSIAGLSREEGAKLQDALGSLSFRQSTEQTNQVLKEIMGLTDRAIKISTDRYGKPAEPGAQPAPGVVEQTFKVDF